MESEGRKSPVGPVDVEAGIPGSYQLDALLHGWRFQRAWHAMRIELVDRVLPPTDGWVLDAACGAGILRRRFSDRAARLVSFDRRTTACHSIKTRSPEAIAVAGDLRALPFPSTTFTTMYLLEVIEHLVEADGVDVLRELCRTAAAGGRILVTTPNYRSVWPLLEWSLDTLRLTPPMRGGQHQSNYTRASLTRAISAAGWRVERVGTFNLLAPVAHLISTRFGAWTVDLESRRLGGGGPLIYAVATKPQ